MTNPITLRRNNDPYTSHESANKVEANQMEKIVWEVIDSFGETGCISDQVQYALPEYRYSTITARYKALKEKGLVIVDGSAVKGESGRKQMKMWSARHYFHQSVTDEDIIQHQHESQALDRHVNEMTSLGFIKEI
jgi:hypothetical protein